MSKSIAYDIMRLFIGPSSVTPRGIDRIDLALAKHVFSDEFSLNIGVLPTPAGVYGYSASQVRRLLTYLQELWAEDTEMARDVQLRALLNKIQSRPAHVAPVSTVTPLSLRNKTWRMLRMLHATNLLPSRFAHHVAPHNAVYVNIGQLGLAMPSFFNWLTKRPDITRAMMVHDAIPIDHPHLVGDKAPAHHRQMIRTAAKYADCMIFNSAYTCDSVNTVMRGMGHICPPGLVRSLPLPSAFLNVGTSIAELSGTRYFLAVSTIEPRKNFALLLRVWQRFVTTMGTDAPHLVIVGAPGSEAPSILAPLTTDPALAGRVHHVVGLSSPALASLLLGATAMLCPTLAEGFGLPLLEANAMGVPAIVSDIPAHREIANATTMLISADADEDWARAIAALPDATTRARPDIPFAVTETAYCADIVDFIMGFRPDRFN